MSDDAVLRRLRFSRWLQVAAAVLFGVAFVVRLVAVGLDGVTLLLLAAMVVAAVAAVLTTRVLRG